MESSWYFTVNDSLAEVYNTSINLMELIHLVVKKQTSLSYGNNIL